MRGCYSVNTAVPAGSSLFNFPIARGFTRLSAIYCSFVKAGDKWCTTFCSPLQGQDNTTAFDSLEYNICLGSERLPSFNMDSVREASTDSGPVPQ